MKQIKYTEGYKYQLEEDYTDQTPLRPNQDIDTPYISLTKDGVLTIRQGYAWDGPSGPTADTKDSMRGALKHDAGYQLTREGFLPIEFRAILDEMLEADCDEDAKIVYASSGIIDKIMFKAAKIRFSIWHWGVKYFAKSAAEWKSERKILTAP